MIDERLLIHSCMAYKVQSMDADRKPVYDDGTTLKNVRLSIITATTQDNDGKHKADSMSLYFDCMSSKPIGFIPEEGMLIKWGDKSYTVRSVKPSYSVTGSSEFYKADLV